MSELAAAAAGMGREDDVEAALAAEEAALIKRAEALERQVRQHKAAKEAARAAKKLAEERQAQEAELQRWSTELRAEVDSAIQRLTAQREEVSGVNVDEELVKMIQFEQAYSAAAQFLQVVTQLNDQVMALV